MLPYFPFVDDTFKMVMGVTALHDRGLIDVDDEQYRAELTLKQRLLAEAYDQYFQALPETEPAQWEVVALLLYDMVAHYPHHFELVIEGKQWTWRNRLLNEETYFIMGEQASLPVPPLDWVGRQMQEDLLILSGNAAAGMPLVAGQLCFPNGWCLDDKMGKSFLGIHDEVPLFEKHLGRSSSLLLERLKPERPVWRVNWSLKATSRLNLMPRILAEEQRAHLTLENVGACCLLRLERQMLARLPQTDCILFTIHTYQAPLDAAIESAEAAQRIASVVRTMPEEMLVYKGIAPFVDPLLAYLEAKER